MDYPQIVIAPVCVGVNMLTQVVVFRGFSKTGLLRSEYIGFLCGFIVFILAESCIFSLQSAPMPYPAAIFAVNLIIYCSLGYVYFHFIALGETARRIRILRELYDAKDGLSAEEILKRYSAKEIFENRIDRLIQNGQIALRQGRYYIGSPLMLFVTRIIIIFKLIMLGKSSES